jgi:hypothetical protein
VTLLLTVGVVRNRSRIMAAVKKPLRDVSEMIFGPTR